MVYWMIEWLIKWLNGLLTVYWFIEWYRCNKCTTPIHFFNHDQWSFVLQLNAVWQFDNTELVEQLPKWRETTITQWLILYSVLKQSGNESGEPWNLRGDRAWEKGAAKEEFEGTSGGGRSRNLELLWEEVHSLIILTKLQTFYTC